MSKFVDNFPVPVPKWRRFGTAPMIACYSQRVKGLQENSDGEVKIGPAFARGRGGECVSPEFIFVIDVGLGAIFALHRARTRVGNEMVTRRAKARRDAAG